jgi:hypothetical protein
MTSKPNKAKFDSERLDHEIASRRRPDLDTPATEPVLSGVRPDLAEPGPDGYGGDAGGVGKSI